MHRGRKVTEPLLVAQAHYAGVASSSLGLPTKVMIDTGDASGGRRLLVDGDLIEVGLYATFNLANVINKLVVTLDFLLATSPDGEREFLDRMSRQIRWSDPGNRTVRRLQSALRHMNYPNTALGDALLAGVASAL